MLEKIKSKWEDILLHIKEEHELTDVSFKTWLLPTQPWAMKGGALQILVPDYFILFYFIYFNYLTSSYKARVFLACSACFLTELPAWQ